MITSLLRKMRYVQNPPPEGTHLGQIREYLGRALWENDLPGLYKVVDSAPGSDRDGLARRLLSYDGGTRKKYEDKAAMVVAAYLNIAFNGGEPQEFVPWTALDVGHFARRLGKVQWDTWTDYAIPQAAGEISRRIRAAEDIEAVPVITDFRKNPNLRRVAAHILHANRWAAKSADSAYVITGGHDPDEVVAHGLGIHATHRNLGNMIQGNVVDVHNPDILAQEARTLRHHGAERDNLYRRSAARLVLRYGVPDGRLEAQTARRGRLLLHLDQSEPLIKTP